MGLLSEISAYMVTNSIGIAGTGATGSWNIYYDKGELPAGPDQVILLFETGGMPPDLIHDMNIDVNPSMQVRIRAKPKDYAGGIAKAEAILALLHGLSNTTLGTTPYKLIRALSSPIYLGNDKSGRPEWTVNFQISKNL